MRASKKNSRFVELEKSLIACHFRQWTISPDQFLRTCCSECRTFADLGGQFIVLDEMLATVTYQWANGTSPSEDRRALLTEGEWVFW